MHKCEKRVFRLFKRRWRRRRDSNPWIVAHRLISSQLPSTTRPLLRRVKEASRIESRRHACPRQSFVRRAEGQRRATGLSRDQGPRGAALEVSDRRVTPVVHRRMPPYREVRATASARARTESDSHIPAARSSDKTSAGSATRPRRCAATTTPMGFPGKRAATRSPPTQTLRSSRSRSS